MRFLHSPRYESDPQMVKPNSPILGGEAAFLRISSHRIKRFPEQIRTYTLFLYIYNLTVHDNNLVLGTYGRTRVSIAARAQ